MFLRWLNGRDDLCPLEPFDLKRLTKALPWEAPTQMEGVGNQVEFHPKCCTQKAQYEVIQGHRHRRYLRRGFLVLGPPKGKTHELWQWVRKEDRMHAGWGLLAPRRHTLRRSHAGYRTRGSVWLILRTSGAKAGTVEREQECLSVTSQGTALSRPCCCVLWSPRIPGRSPTLHSSTPWELASFCS